MSEEWQYLDWALGRQDGPRINGLNTIAARAYTHDMFTGLIQHLAHVAAADRTGSGGLRLQIAVDGLDPTPAVGDSIAIEGCCLTVSEAPEITGGRCLVAFEAIPQTLEKTMLGTLEVGDTVHLEPAMRVGEPLGGHLVQGHVDSTAEVKAVSVDGSDHRVRLALEPETGALVMLRGSVCLAGVSLTVAEVHEDGFSVCLIPTTLEHTRFDALQVGDQLNVEADMLVRAVAQVIRSMRDSNTM